MLGSSLAPEGALKVWVPRPMEAGVVRVYRTVPGSLPLSLRMVAVTRLSRTVSGSLSTLIPMESRL